MVSKPLVCQVAGLTKANSFFPPKNLVFCEFFNLSSNLRKCLCLFLFLFFFVKEKRVSSPLLKGLSFYPIDNLEK